MVTLFNYYETLFNAICFRWSQVVNGRSSGDGEDEAAGLVGECLAREACRGYLLVIYYMKVTSASTSMFYKTIE